MASPWLIYGGHGWIAGQFCAILTSRGIPFILGEARADSADHVEAEIEAVRPARVISMIGRTHGGAFSTIDYLEQGRPQLVENIRDNLFGPMVLALLCQKHGIHCTYLGTGCIFTYDDAHDVTTGFTEDDMPNFFGSGYSICKGFTDRLMKLVGDNTLNVRIRMPINDDLESPRNFLHKILHYKKICSIPNSMTVLPDLLPVLCSMIERQSVGTVNLTNPGVITHNQILDMYTALIDPEFTYENFSVEEQNQVLAAERSNNALATERLESEYFVLPIYQSLQRLFKRIRKERLIHQPYRISRILVTGGWGFIGSNFIHELYRMMILDGSSSSSASRRPFEIVQLDKLSYCSRQEYLEDIPGIVHYRLDLNETDAIEALLAHHEIETIVHFAAQSHVDLSFNNSMSFTQDNVRGTHSLLEAARRYGRIRRFLHVSTDEVYGETIQKEAFREDQIPNPTNPYAATKIAAEFLVQSYFHCFELPVIIIRGNNVYGPHQYPEKLIPRFILRLLDGRRCPIHGNGQTRRNFVHVSDMCAAVLCLLQKGRIAEIYNIGNDNEYSVIQIARLLVDAIVSPEARLEDHIEFQEDRYYNDFTYRIDSDKLRALGWRPQIGMVDGLRRCVEWYRDHAVLYPEFDAIAPTPSQVEKDFSIPHTV